MSNKKISICIYLQKRKTGKTGENNALYFFRSQISSYSLLSNIKANFVHNIYKKFTVFYVITSHIPVLMCLVDDFVTQDLILNPTETGLATIHLEMLNN